MGDPRGFLKYQKEQFKTIDVKERIKNFNEFCEPTSEDDLKQQSARCMCCGVPFCHSSCPLGNFIPDFNDTIYLSEFEKSYKILSTTNNFPEFTGRVCPAPCEASCVLGINSDNVSIEYIERNIIETAFKNAWVDIVKYRDNTNKSVAIIGSGPSGLAAADQLSKAGHNVTVYEKNDKIGGLLRYGIPDFKLEKKIVDRRIDVMKKSGVKFVTNAYIGRDVRVEKIQNNFDAIILCGGSTVPRDINIEGRDAKGIHFAMEFLELNNRYVSGGLKTQPKIFVKNKDVVIIGGGDTGSDCVGTSNRQQARFVTQIELLPKPLNHRTNKDPWPLWPMTLKTSSSHQEGCDRRWAMFTKRFIKNSNGELSGLEVSEVNWDLDIKTGKMNFIEKPNTTSIINCSYAFIAIGFLHPEHKYLLEGFKIKLTKEGTVETNNYQTNIPNIFSAGDMRRGQSLVVWAISEGREAAVEVDKFLMGDTVLKNKNASELTI